MDRRWVLLLLVLVLIWRERQSPSPGPSLPQTPPSFTDQLLGLINHQVTVYTSGPEGFTGILTAVNPDFLTLFERVSPPRAAFIPLHMIAAVTVSGL